MHKTKDSYEPKKTIIAYKLFTVKKSHPGKLFPLYIGASDPLEMGVWYDAQIGERTENGKVKSKLGELAMRPGWHMGDYPSAKHIGGIDTTISKKPSYRLENQVWAEVECADDVDWQTEAINRAEKTKDGRIYERTAHITDGIPENGFYRYKTNPNALFPWIIAGTMKINRLLTDDEVMEINSNAGFEDLPRKIEFDFEKYGFENPSANILTMK